ncbi:protein DGCR6-like isoform X2 [Dinothrombium tinctorium]|uniref:Protein DGCR6-like isoform X2 n=1 Tax=Dinothrombium tinctorium TaxID=1965070 RepID=A0A3S3RZ37_9ACAR|nr:protein DGCR6-like isoform X2 [Dinothrombium tinctorium]RWS07948.1 protein DGCR6-like isoform X2 [Dinothrombium tinctorium]RWS08151.1 protein DGCR6-like isoform X2 [Dinothrombium tinctorium]
MYSNYLLNEENENEEFAKRERLQQKHYKLLNELQTMASELPIQYQQRLPYELLSNLANCLLDDTIYQIVKGLKDIQHITEKNLFEKRQKAIENFKAMKFNLQKKHKEALSNGSMTSNAVRTAQIEFDKYIEDETRKLDMKAILELDQVVSEQQVTLERAGVPGFHVTNNPQEVQLQMHLLSFISRIETNSSLD